MFKRGQIWKDSKGDKFRVVAVNADWKELHIEFYTEGNSTYQDIDIHHMEQIVKNQKFKLISK